MRRHLFVALAGWLVAQAASATSIVYLEDLREIHIEESSSTHGSGYSLTAEPDSPFSSFARSLDGNETFALQSSAMNAVQMTASGEAGVWVDIFTNGPLAYSTFHVEFEITEATPFTLDGSISRHDFRLAGTAEADVSLRLSSGGVDLYFLETGAGFTPLTLPVSASGELAPGVYELYVSAVANATNLGGASYDIAFSVLPEPTTATLLLAGLLAFVAGRSLDRSRA
jgi:hypothetical protein